MLDAILAHRFGVARFLSILITIAVGFYMADGLGWYWYIWWPASALVYAAALLALGLFLGALWQRRRPSRPVAPSPVPNASSTSSRDIR